MRRAVLMICDGLRADLVSEETCPEITRLARAGRWFARHTAVFPSVTRVSTASIATGCWPRRHGLPGNWMALDDGAGPTVRDAGTPEFRGQMRRALGRTLAVPTLAQRLAAHGGAIVLANVSPGAAYLHDPDGFGHVYHRAGSLGPGGTPLAPLAVGHDAAGDLAMTEQFCAEVLLERRPALAVLWLCQPDDAGHDFGLGSPEHLAAVAAADRCVGLVAEAVRRLQAQGDEVLLLVGADHGQETAAQTVDLEGELVAAGLKESPGSSEVLVADQGSAALIYVSEQSVPRVPALTGWLRAQPWLDQLFAGDALATVGLVPEGGLAIALSLAKSSAPNAFGVSGLSWEIGAVTGVPEPPGRATHGGLGRYETHPFLVAVGAGVTPGTATEARSSVIDLAPTILRHLGRPHDDLDGTPLDLG